MTGNKIRKKSKYTSVQKEYEDPWNKLFVDLDAIRSNYLNLRNHMRTDAILFAVLKSDAYGHGIVEVGKTLSEAGCLHFAVETPQEGILLRNEHITGEILLMNPIPENMAELCVRNDLSVSVIALSILAPLESAAKQMGVTCRIHLNANVGLNRMGIDPAQIFTIAKDAKNKSHLELQGLFGQPRSPESAISSFRTLKKIYQELKKQDVAPNYLHFANSTTLLSHPETTADGIRIGILLYGILPPEHHSNPDNLSILPALSLETVLVQTRHLLKGSSIGYHSKVKTDQNLKIGTIPIGYNHGLDRKLEKNGYVLVRGEKAPFIGTISMNSSTIDISDIEKATIGDPVVVIGKQKGNIINISDIANKSNTIAAELLTRFGKSIPKCFITSNQENSRIKFVEKKEKETITINYCQSEDAIPKGINVIDIVGLIHTHMVPYEDPKIIITTAVEYALSSYPSGKGFILVANCKKKLIGASVCIQMDKIGIIPENMLVYLCVHKDYRRRGIGSRLLQETLWKVDGDVKLHIEKNNPAIKLYKKMGFKDEYFEMRLDKGGNH